MLLLFIFLECFIEDCMTKNGDYRDFLECGKPKALNANGYVPITFNLGTHFGDTEAGALELKGDYFLSMAPGDFVPPDYTHPKRLEDRTAYWWLSCQDTEPTPEYLNMVVHTACTFASFVNPFANIQDERIWLPFIGTMSICGPWTIC